MKGENSDKKKPVAEESEEDSEDEDDLFKAASKQSKP